MSGCTKPPFTCTAARIARGTLEYARGFGNLLALETGRATLCLGYRLAPEDPFPAALNDAVEAYELMLTRYPAEEIALAGESAGGGLCCPGTPDQAAGLADA